MSVVDHKFSLRNPSIERHGEPEGYAGLRMTADEYFALGETQERYELIDGVVCMSPSPTPKHQDVAGEIYDQLKQYVKSQKLGLLLYETDVYLGPSPRGGDVVYCPDILFIAASRLSNRPDHIRIAPDLVVEVISASTRAKDWVTKRNDYERVGVKEYWIIDPGDETFTFLRLENEKFSDLTLAGDMFDSAALPGFQLALAPVRRKFREI